MGRRERSLIDAMGGWASLRRVVDESGGVMHLAMLELSQLVKIIVDVATAPAPTLCGVGDEA